MLRQTDKALSTPLPRVFDTEPTTGMPVPSAPAVMGTEHENVEDAVRTGTLHEIADQTGAKMEQEVLAPMEQWLRLFQVPLSSLLLLSNVSLSFTCSTADDRAGAMSIAARGWTFTTLPVCPRANSNNNKLCAHYNLIQGGLIMFSGRNDQYTQPRPVVRAVELSGSAGLPREAGHSGEASTGPGCRAPRLQQAGAEEGEEERERPGATRRAHHPDPIQRDHPQR